MKVSRAGVRAGGGAIRGLVAGADDDADLLDPGAQDFLDDDRERGLGDAVAIDERLQRERALVFAGGGDEGLADVHGRVRRELPKSGRSVNQRARDCRVRVDRS